MHGRLIVIDLLTNPRYAGFPAANLDAAGALADWGSYCQAAQLAMSLLIDRQQPCARWLEEIALLTVSAVVWSGSLLKIIPFGDQPLSANGTSWAPNLTWQYSLGDDDFIDFGGGSDPVLCPAPTRRRPRTGSASSTWTASTTTTRGPRRGPGPDHQHGHRGEPAIQAHEPPIRSAPRLAQLQLQRRAYVRFKLGWNIHCSSRWIRAAEMRHWDLRRRRCGSCRSTKTTMAVDRHRRRDFWSNPDAGTITLIVGTAPAILWLSTAGSGIDTLADPGDSNPPIIFEPPAALSGGVLEVWIIVRAALIGRLPGLRRATMRPMLAGTIYPAPPGVLTPRYRAMPIRHTVDTLPAHLSERGTIKVRDDGHATICHLVLLRRRAGHTRP